MSGRGDDRISAAMPRPAAHDAVPLRTLAHDDGATLQRRARTVDQRVERTCANCRFWERGDDLGFCRLNAPTVTWDRGQVMPVTLWPETEETDWCGLWQHDRRGAQPDERRKAFAETATGESRSPDGSAP